MTISAFPFGLNFFSFQLLFRSRKCRPNLTFSSVHVLGILFVFVQAIGNQYFLLSVTINEISLVLSVCITRKRQRFAIWKRRNDLSSSVQSIYAGKFMIHDSLR